ncbi:uncharacterized protein LOC106063039 [Biomphalaria glabrata]|uniref:Uncharacterized protein LOC106063039 n=1 Tax=Biomphalaria glabrata TaxID=6526 RepID=A0A9U8E8V9_BIOGL|nr:uncharacterized protein LOC106063039 [Biomphalaria glabrata]
MLDIRTSLNDYNRREINNLSRTLENVGLTEAEAHDWIGKDESLFHRQFVSLYDVNGQLKIHPLALFALNKKEKNDIEEITKKINNGDLSISLSVKNNPAILKKYEIQLDRQIIFKENKLSELFGKNLRDVKINGKAIFANIKPFEIKRMYDLFMNNSKIKNYVQVMEKFAQLNKVENVSDFCACGEYIYRELSKSIKEATKSSQCQADIQLKEKETLNEFICENTVRDMFKDRFTTVVDNCIHLMTTKGLHFSSPMTYANHYVKHAVETCCPETATEETYLRLANKHVSEGQADVTLTQDGTFLKHKYQHDNKLVILVEDVNTGKKNIATFFKTKN